VCDLGDYVIRKKEGLEQYFIAAPKHPDLPSSKQTYYGMAVDHRRGTVQIGDVQMDLASFLKAAERLRERKDYYEG
jgi:hypothetical protein